MRRALSTLLLSLVLVAAAATGPAFACVGEGALVGTSQHSCCDEAFSAAPLATCCVVAQPLRDRALTESRLLLSNHRQVAQAVAPTRAWFTTADAVPRRGSPPIIGSTPALPIYLQQLALLI